MNVAFIPVRGGSKSIPLKNIKPLLNKPLVYWTVAAAKDCKSIDKVYVSTDSIEIKNVVEGFNFKNVEVISRSSETASDTASTESAMLEFANNYDFESIVLIQATSPLLTTTDLDNGFKVYNKDGVDSVLSAVKQKRFNWTSDDGFASSINYDYKNRPRRQEFEGYYTENGAFYITSKELLLKSKNRISGNIMISEMAEDTFFEIDEPSDFVLIEQLMKKRNIISPVCIPKIKMLLTDCDGCLTDAGMYYSENGDELKKFNTKDGAGAALLKEKGLILGIVTGEDVELNRWRARKMKFDLIESGISDKLTVVKNISKKYNIPLENIAYIGDDIIDEDVIKAVGFGACPADAVNSVKDASDYIANAKGGEGVFREIADIIYKSL